MNMLLIIYIFTHLFYLSSGVCNFGIAPKCLDDIRPSCNFSKNRTSLKFSESPYNPELSEYLLEFISLENDCSFDSYDVTVERMNTDNEADCKYKESVLDGKTFQRFHISNAPLCSKLKLEFCLVYWFRGCYLLLFAPRSGHNSQRPVAHYIWLQNNYTFQDFEIPTPDIVNYDIEPFTTTWTFQKDVQLKTFRNDNESYDVQLRKVDEKEHNILDVTQSCIFLDQRITCEVKNLTAGNYSIRLTLNDDWRCVNYGVFDNCEWTHYAEHFQSPDSSEIQVTHASSYNYYNLILIIGFVVILIAIVYFIYYYIRKRKSRALLDVPAEEIKLNLKSEGNKIFLLYARDCSPFMDAMVNLNRYLAEQSGCKVYDIYDNSQFNDLIKSPFDYIEMLLRDENCHVIIIATKCAELLHEASQKYMSFSHPTVQQILYREYNPIDRFMIYAMKLTSFDTSKTSYKKFFVIRLPDLNDSKDYLCHINPGTRYDIPSGLDTLLESLAPGRPAMARDSLHRKEELQRALCALRQYVLQNPEYLRDHILN